MCENIDDTKEKHSWTQFQQTIDFKENIQKMEN